MRHWMLSTVAAVAAVAIAFVGYSQAGDKQYGKDKNKTAAVAIGQPAPTFALEDHNGETVDLADYADKIVVLEWFNEDCPYVVKFYQEGHMNAWADKYAEQGVVWLRVNTTAGKNHQTNKAIAQKWNIDRPILNDSAGDVGKTYGATNTPHMYIINKGQLVYMGAIDSNRSARTSDIEGATNYVVKALDEILAGQSVSEPQTRAYGCTIKYTK